MNFGRNQVLVAIAVLAVAVVIIAPMVVSTSKSNRIDEVQKNVDAIRDAELQYKGAFGEYVSAEAAPRAAHAVDGTEVAWAASEGFRKLSWAPDTETLLCSYQVQADGQGFKVIGACDVDGDGERAVWEATQDQPAASTTRPGAY